MTPKCECLNLIGAVLDLGFNFTTKNEMVRKTINDIKYFLDKESLENVFSIYNPMTTCPKVKVPYEPCGLIHFPIGN